MSNDQTIVRKDINYRISIFPHMNEQSSTERIGQFHHVPFKYYYYYYKTYAYAYNKRFLDLCKCSSITYMKPCFLTH